MKVWSWRQAVQRSSLPSTTKLVLLNLSVYMNDAGDSCFPTVRQQALDTGLSERAVCDHLGRAVEAGFISKSVHGYSGQRWARHEYAATFPKNCALGSEKGTDGGSVPQAKGTERPSVPRDKALTLTQEGTDGGSTKALTEGQSNSPVTLQLTPHRARGAVDNPRSPRPLGSDMPRGSGLAGDWPGIRQVLSDGAWQKAKGYAPDWDLERLMSVYDADIRSGKRPPPQDANRGFPGWVKAYTKGAPPA